MKAYLPGEGISDIDVVIQVINDLQIKGVNPCLFEGTEIFLFPGKYVQLDSFNRPVSGAAKDSSVLIGNQHPNLKNNLLHELGHILGYRNYDLRSYYAEIRKYPFSIEEENQTNLEANNPENNLNEWFAEDFKFLYRYTDIGNGEYRANTTEPGPEVKKFFDSFNQLGETR